MFDIQFDLQPALADLTRLRDRLDDLTPVVEALTNRQYEMTMEDYGAKRSPDGAGWASGPYYKGLVESGDMKAGITKTVGGNTGTIEATDWKSKFHQFGTRNMSQREFIGIGDRHIQELEQTAEKLLMAMLG